MVRLIPHAPALEGVSKHRQWPWHVLHDAKTKTGQNDNLFPGIHL